MAKKQSIKSQLNTILEYGIESVIEIQKLFYEEFRQAYLDEFNLTPEILSVNDVRILKLASKTFGVRHKPDKAIGEE